MKPSAASTIRSASVDAAAVAAVVALLVLPYVRATIATILDTAALLYGAGPTVLGPMLACSVVAFVLALRSRGPASWMVASLPIVGLALATWQAALAAAATSLPGTDTPLEARQLAEGAILFDAAARLRAVASSAAVALALASLAFALCARRRAPTPPALRRLAVLVVGAGAIPALWNLPAITHGFMRDEEVLMATLPAALGVAGVVIAGRPPEDAAERRAWTGDALMSGVLAASATLAMSIAVAAYCALIPLGLDASTPAAPSVELFGEALRGGLPLAVAPLVALLVAWPWRGLRGLVGRGSLALAGACALLLLGPLAIARTVDRAANDVVARAAALEPSLPSDLTLPASAPDGGDCGDLIEDRLLVIGHDHVRLGGRELGGPSVLDTEAGCDAAAGGTGPLFVALDPGGSFERLACVLAARGRLAAPLLKEPIDDSDAWHDEVRARCTFRWVARARVEDGGALTCATRLVPLARCIHTRVQSSESHFELLMRPDGPYELRRRQGRAALSMTEATQADLARVTGEAWKGHGDHIDPQDPRHDKIILQVEPGTSMAEVLKATESVLQPARTRVVRRRDVEDYELPSQVDGPVFEIGFGPPEPDPSPRDAIAEGDRAKVTIGTLDEFRPADRGRAEAAMNASLGFVEACVRSAVGSEAKAEYSIDLRLFVDVDGRVASARLHQYPRHELPGGEAIAACLTKTLEGRALVPRGPAVTSVHATLAVTVP